MSTSQVNKLQREGPSTTQVYDSVNFCNFVGDRFEHDYDFISVKLTSSYITVHDSYKIA